MYVLYEHCLIIISLYSPSQLCRGYVRGTVWGTKNFNLSVTSRLVVGWSRIQLHSSFPRPASSILFRGQLFLRQTKDPGIHLKQYIIFALQIYPNEHWDFCQTCCLWRRVRITIVPFNCAIVPFSLECFWIMDCISLKCFFFCFDHELFSKFWKL